MKRVALVVLPLVMLVSGAWAPAPSPSRPLASAFERILEQPVVVVNEPGPAFGDEGTARIVATIQKIGRIKTK